MKKSEKIVIRLTKEDKELITKNADTAGLSLSSYVLSSIKKLITDA